MSGTAICVYQPYAAEDEDFPYLPPYFNAGGFQVDITEWRPITVPLTASYDAYGAPINITSTGIT